MTYSSHRQSSTRRVLTLSLSPSGSAGTGAAPRGRKTDSKPTPLAVFVRRRLEELELKQSGFCRLTGFDQGLLSKIQNSIISSLSLESTLRLALGLNVAPRVIFSLTDRMDMQELVINAYATEFIPELSARGLQLPPSVFEITSLALCAYSMGRNLAPACALLSHLASGQVGPNDDPESSAPDAEAYGL